MGVCSSTLGHWSAAASFIFVDSVAFHSLCGLFLVAGGGICSCLRSPLAVAFHRATELPDASLWSHTILPGDFFAGVLWSLHKTWWDPTTCVRLLHFGRLRRMGSPAAGLSRSLKGPAWTLLEGGYFLIARCAPLAASGNWERIAVMAL